MPVGRARERGRSRLGCLNRNAIIVVTSLVSGCCSDAAVVIVMVISAADDIFASDKMRRIARPQSAAANPTTETHATSGSVIIPDKRCVRDRRLSFVLSKITYGAYDSNFYKNNKCLVFVIVKKIIKHRFNLRFSSCTRRLLTLSKIITFALSHVVRIRKLKIEIRS